MNEYDLDYIDKLRIHELRDFARRLGISSPTTLKKEDLLNKIYLAISNTEESDMIFKNKFKTPEELDFFSLLTEKNSDILNDLLNSEKPKRASSKPFIAKMITNKSIDVDAQSNNGDYKVLSEITPVSFSCAQEIAEYGNTDYSIIEGYIDIHPNGYGIVRQNGYMPCKYDVYVPQAIVRKYSLKKGYIVRGKAKAVLENKPIVLYDLEWHEGKNLSKHITTFDEYNYSPAGGKFYLDKFNLSIAKGDRLYCSSMSLNDCIDLANDLCLENSASVKVINIKAKPEENYESNEKLEIINCYFGTEEIEIVNTVELVLERIKREFEVKRPNVLIIYNFSELIKIINVAIEGFYDFSKFNSKTINKIYNILNIAKYVNDKYYSSIICIDKNGCIPQVNTIMQNEIIPYFNGFLPNDHIRKSF